MQDTDLGPAEPRGPETRLPHVYFSSELQCLLFLSLPASVSLSSLCKLTFLALCGWKWTSHGSLVFKSFFKGSAALSASLKSQFRILIGPAAVRYTSWTNQMWAAGKGVALNIGSGACVLSGFTTKLRIHYSHTRMAEINALAKSNGDKTAPWELSRSVKRHVHLGKLIDCQS